MRCWVVAMVSRGESCAAIAGCATATVSHVGQVVAHTCAGLVGLRSGGGAVPRLVRGQWWFRVQQTPVPHLERRGPVGLGRGADQGRFTEQGGFAGFTEVRCRCLRLPHLVRGGSQRPGFGRQHGFLRREQGFPFRDEMGNLGPPEGVGAEVDEFRSTLDEPPPARNREIRALRGEPNALRGNATRFRAQCGGFCHGTTGSRAGNEECADVQRALGERCDPILLPLVPTVLAVLVSGVVVTDHAGQSRFGDVMAPIDPGVHLFVAEELGRMADRGAQNRCGEEEITRSYPRVLQRVRAPSVRAEAGQAGGAVPRVLQESPGAVQHRLATVAVLAHRGAPGHHLSGLHERISGDAFHRGDTHPVQQAVDCVGARRGCRGQAFHDLGVASQQLGVAIHRGLVLLPGLAVVPGQCFLPESGCLLLQRGQFCLDRAHLVSEGVEGLGCALKFLLDRLRGRGCWFHECVDLLTLRGLVHPGHAVPVPNDIVHVGVDGLSHRL